MSIVLVHAAAQFAAARPGRGMPHLNLLAGGPLVPDPAPVPPPGLTGPVQVILGWVKWGAVIAGTIGLSVCALMMMAGRRSRSTVAADGAAGIPWVLLGLMLAAASSAITGVFL